MRLSKRKRKRIAAKTCGRCATCGGGDDLTVDHIIPKSRGGSDGLANLRLLCGPCNRAKSNTIPDHDELPTRKLRRAWHRARVSETRAGAE